MHHTRVVGYQHDDAQKVSYPLTEVYIYSPNKEEYRISAPKKREDIPPLNYISRKTEDILDTKNSYYEGCYKITPRRKIHIYERPDQTLYQEILGNSSSVKSGNLCRTYEETQVHKSSSWILTHNGKEHSDPYFPPGSFDGEWLTCATVQRFIPWHSRSGVEFFLRHHSSRKKRTKTEYPSGKIIFGEWATLEGATTVATTTCRHS